MTPTSSRASSSQVVKSLTPQQCLEVAREYGFSNVTTPDAVKMFKFHRPSTRTDVTFGGLDENAKKILRKLGRGEYNNTFVQDLYDRNGTKIIFKDWVGEDPLLQSSGYLCTETLELYCQVVFKTSFGDFVEGCGGDVHDRRLNVKVRHIYIAQYIELLIKTHVQPSRAIGEELQTALNLHYASMVGDVRADGPFEWDDRVDEAFQQFLDRGMHRRGVYRRDK